MKGEKQLPHRPAWPSEWYELQTKELVEKCWQIAHLPPEATDGDVSGQMAALNVVSHVLKFRSPGKLEDLAKDLITLGRTIQALAKEAKSAELVMKNKSVKLSKSGTRNAKSSS